MIVMKIKLTQDELGALHADFIGGMNSVSQNNASNNYIEATLDGFKVNVDDGEILEISYATTLNESDAETDNVGYTMMSYNADRETWSIEVDPIVLARRGVWYLSLRVATYLEGKRVGASKSVENLEFTVNADIYNSNGEYPNKGDVATFYQNALKSEAVAKEAVTAAATAMEAAEGVLKAAVKKTGDTMTGPLIVENSRSLGRSGVIPDGFHVQSGEEAETHYGQGFILRKANTNEYPNGELSEIVNALPQESGTLVTEEKARSIANEEIAKFDFINIVAELPETGLPNRFYLVPKENGTVTDLFDAYIWVINDEYPDGRWEYEGVKSGEIDLTILKDYVKFTDVSTIQGTTIDSGKLSIFPANAAAIDKKVSYRQPIVPAWLDHAVKVGITTNTETLTDAEKAAALAWLGATKLYQHNVKLSGDESAPDAMTITIINTSPTAFASLQDVANAIPDDYMTGARRGYISGYTDLMGVIIYSEYYTGEDNPLTLHCASGNASYTSFVSDTVIEL